MPLAGHLRVGATMIDEETERAVAGWVRLGDQLSGRQTNEGRQSCWRCGTTFRVLGRIGRVLCARCYLERGEGDGSDAA